MNYLKAAIVSALLLTLVSCHKKAENAATKKQHKEVVTIKYAKGFDIVNFKNYRKLIVKAPYKDAKETFEYILTSSKSKNINTLKVPVNAIVVTSTTHIPMLEVLGVENKLVGFPHTSYISSKKTRNLIAKGRVKELGHEERINTELLLDLQPDVVVGFSLGSNNKMFATIQKMGIPVILNGDWLEETPLGRAEWIKFFGVLFNKEKEADSIFNVIEATYLAAKKIALKDTLKPSVISGGLYKDVWNLPAGESFEATFLKDANTKYLWKNTKGKGSLLLSIESVFDKGKNADIWISPSFYSSKEQLKKANSIYTKFKAFQENNLYSFVNKRGETGGLIYFELAPTRPDLVLKDLIKIAHPNLLKNYELTFFEKLN